MNSSQSLEAARVALYALIAIWALRKAYRALPSWLTKSKQDAAKDANDDIANPMIIIQKLQNMMKLVSKKVEDDLPWFKLYAAFISYVHLQRELQVAYPKHKNERHEKDTEPLEGAQLKELARFCNFAKMAYLDSYLELHASLKSLGFDLLRHDTATEPGRVGHFVAVNHLDKLAIISIKGTNTISDALTDVMGNAVDCKLDTPIQFEGESIQTIRVHEGMLTAANMICDDTLHLVDKFFIPTNYKVLITGHSLGAGVACLLGMFLQSRVNGVTRENLRVFAFATPACLDFTTAHAVMSFTTSVVNDTDCVPRLSVMNLVTLNKLFVFVDKKLQKLGLSPDSFQTAKAYFADLLKVDDKLLMKPQELQDFETEIIDVLRHDEDKHSLFVPGRVVVMWENNGEQFARIGDPGMNVLRRIEVAKTMISDHSCTKYLENLVSLSESGTVDPN